MSCDGCYVSLMGNTTRSKNEQRCGMCLSRMYNSSHVVIKRLLIGFISQNGISEVGCLDDNAGRMDLPPITNAASGRLARRVGISNDSRQSTRQRNSSADQYIQSIDGASIPRSTLSELVLAIIAVAQTVVSSEVPLARVKAKRKVVHHSPFSSAPPAVMNVK